MSELQPTTQMISNGWFYDSTHNCWALPEDEHLEALRACESRVRDRCALEIDHGPQMGNSLEWMLNPIRKHHYERGLDAARDAVRRICGHTKYEGCRPCAHSDALAAIDALLGES